MDAEMTEWLRGEVRRLKNKDPWTSEDLSRAKNIAAMGDEVRRDHDRSGLIEMLVNISGPMPDGEQTGVSARVLGTERGLIAAMKEQHFDVKTNPRAYVTAEQALGVKAASFDGTIGEDTLPRIVSSPELGSDTRFIYPRFPFVGVEPDVANVSTLSQKSRTLASPTDMVRAIDDVTDKPETDTEATVVALPLQQVANIQTGVPLIVFSSQIFRTWIQNDVELAWRFAVDRMVMDAIDGAIPPTVSGGFNVYESILYAMEAVRAAGYQPDTVALSPQDALSVELLQLEGGTTYAFSQRMPTMTISPALSDGEGFVADSGSAGTLYSSPTRFETFVDDAGKNTYLVRYESNAAFALHRADAICTLAGTS